MREKTTPDSSSWILKLTAAVVVVISLAAAGFLIGQRTSNRTSAARTGESEARLVKDGSSRNNAGSARPDSGSSALTGAREPSFRLSGRTESPPKSSKDEFVRWMTAHTSETVKYLEWRWDLTQDLRSWGMITDERMLEAFLMTPREHFCREWNLHKAYLDIWMNIGYGVTITDPSVVCRMTETILPEPDQKVLEIGTGSGYQSAILSNLSNHVYTIEIIEDLARETDELYTSLEPEYPWYTNIRRKIDDGYYGWAEKAPFDRIIVTCSIDHIPPILLRQLAPDGIMIIPVGPPGTQTLLRVTKRVEEDGTVRLERADMWGSPVTFVPFKDKSGEKHTLDESP